MSSPAATRAADSRPRNVRHRTHPEPAKIGRPPMRGGEPTKPSRLRRHAIVERITRRLGLRSLAHISGTRICCARSLRGRTSTARPRPRFSDARSATSRRRSAATPSDQLRLIYGMSAFRLRSSWPRARHRTGLHRKLLHPLPGRGEVHGRNAQGRARSAVTSETVFGRRLWLPGSELQSRPPRRGRARAINAPCRARRI